MVSKGIYRHLARLGRDIFETRIKKMNSPVMRLVKSNSAVEQGIIVAGVTVTGVAVLQT